MHKEQIEDAMREAMESSATPAESIPPPATAEALLTLAKSLIEDNLLTPEQLADLQEDPEVFLIKLLPDDASEDTIADLVHAVEDAIVHGFFQSLLAKASEGEKYDEARLKKALLKAQVAAVEALEGSLSGAAPDLVIRIAGALQN